MDYQLFLLAAIRERFEATGDTNTAVREGIARTGRPITNAALIMIVVFVAFGVTGPIPPTELGITLALAVLLDATVVRVLVVPATMALLGDRNWYLPKWLGKVLPKVSFTRGMHCRAPLISAAGTPWGVRGVMCSAGHRRPVVGCREGTRPGGFKMLATRRTPEVAEQSGFDLAGVWPDWWRRRGLQVRGLQAMIKRRHREGWPPEIVAQPDERMAWPAATVSTCR